jgi:hypothetical protein
LPLDIKELSKTENSILESKRELTRISEGRWKAILANDERAALRSRMEAADKTLSCCKTIATYLRNFSTPVAREIEMRQESVKREFEKVRVTQDPWELHSWIKTQLVPLVNTSERMAHVAASSVSKTRGLDMDFHRWTGSARKTRGR